MSNLEKTLDAIRNYPDGAIGSAWSASTQAERKAMEAAIVAYQRTGSVDDGNMVRALAKSILARIKRDNPGAVPVKRKPRKAKPTLVPFFGRVRELI